MKINTFLIPLLFVMTLFMRSSPCSCQIVALPQSVDSGDQCYAQYKFLGYLDFAEPSGKRITFQAEGDKCGLYSFGGNTFINQNFTYTVKCPGQAGSGDNTIQLNGSIFEESLNKTCTCSGETQITCPTSYVWVIILSIVGGILLFGVVGYVIWKRYKKRKSEGYAQMDN